METTTIRIAKPSEHDRVLANYLTPQERLYAIVAAAKQKIEEIEENNKEHA